MDRRFVVLICSVALLGLASIPAAAQQKTAKQCNDEWAANKAAIQASGKTKKVFMADCRGQATATSTAAPKPATAAAHKPPTSAPAAAGNVKTAKQCNDEWAANKAAIQASGKTKKVFMAECREQATATPAAAPKPATAAAPKPPTSAPGAAGHVKTAKQCNDEWAANKAAIQASKKTKKEFMAECRTQPVGASTTTAAPAPATRPLAAAPATPPATSAPARQPSTAAAPTTTTPPPATTRPSTTAPLPAAGQFSTEAQAKARCPGDTVVWVNLDSKVYHFAGTRNYGTTKSGAYMCEKDATSAGSRAAKNEKRP